MIANLSSQYAAQKISTDQLALSMVDLDAKTQKVIISMATKDKVERQNIATTLQQIQAGQLLSGVNAKQIIVESQLTEKQKTRLLNQLGINQAVAQNSTISVVNAIQQINAAKGITQAKKDELIVTLSNIAATQSQTVANNGLATSMKALQASMGVWGWISIAASFLIPVIMELVGGIKSAKEQFKEISDTISQNNTEIDSLNDELKTTQERIAELESMGKLSFTDEAELKKLKSENAELERKIRLLAKENEEKSKEAVKNFKKSYNGFDTEWNWSRTTTDVDNNGNLTAGYITEADYIRETIGLYHELIELEKDVNYKGYTTANGRANGIEENITSEELKKELDGYLKLATEYHDAIDKLYESGYVYGSDAEVDKTIDSMYEIIDLYEASQGETTGLFDSIINRDKYSEARTAIEELATAGNLTAESLQGLYNQDENVKQFYDYISKVFGYDTSNIDKQTAAIKEQADAYNSLVNGNVDYNKRPIISKEQMQLVYPEFNQDLATTYDMDFGLSDMTGEILYTVKLTPILEDDTILNLKSINKYAYEELQSIIDNGGSKEDVLAYDKAHKNILINIDVGETPRDTKGKTKLDYQLEGIKDKHAELVTQLNDNSGFENFANELNKVEEAAASGSNALQTFSSIFDSVQKGTDVLMDAYNDLSDGGEISLEHLMALLDKYPDLVNYIDSENGSHRITIDTLKAKFEAQKEVALQKIETTRKAIELEGAEKSAIEDTLEAMKKKQKQDMAAAMVANGIFKTIGAAIDAINARPGYYLRGLNTSYGYEQAAEKAKNKQLEILDKQAALIKGMTWSDFSGDDDTGSKTIEAVEKQIEDLKHQHEMGLISEAEYYKKVEKIRQDNYANKKDYLDRDRELQEQYHDWEVKNAEDGFEDKIKALQKRYADGKITYGKLQSELTKLINKTFSKDVDTKNKYLAEIPDYLEEAVELLKEAEEEKDKQNREDFDVSYDKLKYQLENGFITEKKYYKDLDALYKKHYGNKTKYLDEYAQYSQEVYDGFKDMYKEDLEADKKTLEEKKEAVTKYYDELIEKIQDAHDKEDYEKEQSEKRKEIFDLDMQIAELMRDGSEKAKARIAELEEERLKAEEELLDFETDKAREDELSRLEKEKEKREKEVQDKIDNIDTKLGNLDTNTADIRNAVIQYAKAKGVNLNFAYASGTRSSVGGLGRINEKGIEMISAPDGNGNYIPMLPNSYVFSAKATEFLWKLATEHSLPQAMYNSIAKSIKTQSSTPSVNIAQPITITMGDIIIKGNADKQTVADIKKEQENTVRMVLQKIKELQK